MAVVDILLRVRDAATPALKAADNAAASLNSTLDSADKRYKSAATSVTQWIAQQRQSFDRMKASLADTAASYPNLQKAMSSLSAGTSTVAKGAAGAVTALAGMAAAGVAIVASVAAIGGAAVAGLGVVVVMAKEAQGRLAELSGVKEIQIAVSPASQAAIDNVSTAIESMKAIFDALVVTIAADVGPTISYIANVVTGFALAGLESFKAFAEGGGSVLGELAYWLANGFIRALLVPINAVQLLLKAMILLGDAVGVPVGALKAADEGISGMIDTAAKYVARQAEAVFVTSSLKKSLDAAAASGAKFNATMGKAVEQRDAKPPTEVKAPTQAEIDYKNYVEVSNSFDKLMGDADKFLDALSGPDFAGAWRIQFEEMAKAAEKALGSGRAVRAARAELIGILGVSRIVASEAGQQIQASFSVISSSKAAQEIKDAWAEMIAVKDTVAEKIGSSGAVRKINEIKEAWKELSEVRENRRARFAGIRELATNAINKVASPASMLSATPVGAAMSMVSAVGKGGGPIAEINTMLTDFTAGLQAFPDAITSGIEVLVKQIIPGLVDALPGAIRGIVGAVGAAIPEVISSIMSIVLDPKFWLDIIKALLQGIVDGIKGAFSVFKENSQDRQDRRAMRREERGFASGLDYVGKTGMAVIHEGEQIVRNGGSMSLAAKRRAGSGAMININVGGGIIDTAGLMQVLREAQRMGDTL
jgi:hypothetical protein